MSTSNRKYDWKKVDWHDDLGRGGYVPRYIRRLPSRLVQWICGKYGHPVEAIEPFQSKYMCGRCYAVLSLDRLIPKEERDEPFANSFYALREQGEEEMPDQFRLGPIRADFAWYPAAGETTWTCPACGEKDNDLPPWTYGDPDLGECIIVECKRCRYRTGAWRHSEAM